MDPFSEARLQAVHPQLREKVKQMAAILEQEGIVIRVTQAFRTSAEQQALYEQGRSRAGKIVTNCPGGHSYHNFGLAVDCVPSIGSVDQSYQPDWNATHPSWKRMEAIGISLGLNSGSTWRTFPDAPHFQLTGRFPVGAPTEEVRELAARGELQTVWDEVTKSLSA